MPLTAASSVYLHLLQNLSLLLLACLFIPLSSLITSICLSITTSLSLIHWARKSTSQPALISSLRHRRVLVTGVGMSKGLFIARAFHQQGHTVIGADFEPHGIPVCGRFSRAIKTFYTLPTPSGSQSGSFTYGQRLVDIVRKENVDLWISCSGVLSAVEDGEAAGMVESRTKCKAIQFNADLTKILNEKDSFIENTKALGLNTPETHLITSVEDAIHILHPTEKRIGSDELARTYILKSVAVDDSVRADMTLLPLTSVHDTIQHVAKFRPSTSRPFVLQQFIRGSEYCTHSVIINGKIAAFTCCASQELLMHYKSLCSKNAISRAMLRFTQTYVNQMTDHTGHFSVDFLIDDSSSRSIDDSIFPIECNPRAHTAVVNFSGDTAAMVEAYLAALGGDSTSREIAVPTTTTGYYWIGHDVVTRLLIPTFGLLTLRMSLKEVLGKWFEFAQHILLWRDPTFAVWDPIPAWWLYCVYWPGMLIVSILGRKWWSRCNVSTGKIFRC